MTLTIDGFAFLNQAEDQGYAVVDSLDEGWIPADGWSNSVTVVRHRSIVRSFLTEGRGVCVSAYHATATTVGTSSEFPSISTRPVRMVFCKLV